MRRLREAVATTRSAVAHKPGAGRSGGPPRSARAPAATGRRRPGNGGRVCADALLGVSSATPAPAGVGRGQKGAA